MKSGVVPHLSDGFMLGQRCLGVTDTIGERVDQLLDSPLSCFGALGCLDLLQFVALVAWLKIRDSILGLFPPSQASIWSVLAVTARSDATSA